MAVFQEVRERTAAKCTFSLFADTCAVTGTEAMTDATPESMLN